MPFAITHDHLEGNYAVNGSDKPLKLYGMSLEAYRATDRSKWHPFRLYDDDDILYYSGICNNQSFAPLDWAMNDSGCTRIDYFNPETNRWETW